MVASTESVSIPSETNRLHGFVALQRSQFNRSQTDLETGYDSHAWGIAGGIDYNVSDRILTGLALSVDRWNGTYDSGQGFDVDATGIQLYTSIDAGSRVHIDGYAGYSRLNINSSRFDGITDASTQSTIMGTDFASSHDDVYSAAVSVGADYDVESVVVTPHIGVAYTGTQYGAYQEVSAAQTANSTFAIVPGGPTGLALAFDATSRTSLQSIVGLKTSWTSRLHDAKVSAEVSFDWYHEFKDNQRQINVHFSQDMRASPGVFSFSTDPPDRDFFYITGGLSVPVNRLIHPFFAFRVLLGNRYYDGTSVFLGIRVSPR